jgi:hypothetical protein
MARDQGFGGMGDLTGPDPWPQRVVLVALAATVLLGLGGSIALSVFGRDPPAVLAALAATACGALSSLAAPIARPPHRASNGGPSTPTTMR